MYSYRQPLHSFINLPCYISHYPICCDLPCNFLHAINLSNLCSITFTSFLTDQLAVGVAPPCGHTEHYTAAEFAGDPNGELHVLCYLGDLKLIIVFKMSVRGFNFFFFFFFFFFRFNHFGWKTCP